MYSSPKPEEQPPIVMIIFSGLICTKNGWSEQHKDSSQFTCSPRAKIGFRMLVDHLENARNVCRSMRATLFMPIRFMPTDSCPPIHAHFFHARSYSCPTDSCPEWPIHARAYSCPDLFMAYKTDSCPYLFMPRLVHALYSKELYSLPIHARSFSL